MNHISSQLTIARTYYKVSKYRHKTGFQATKFLKFRNTCFQVEDDISADTLQQQNKVRVPELGGSSWKARLRSPLLEKPGWNPLSFSRMAWPGPA